MWWEWINAIVGTDGAAIEEPYAADATVSRCRRPSIFCLRTRIL
jgi:hypothetical protein